MLSQAEPYAAETLYYKLCACTPSFIMTIPQSLKHVQNKSLPKPTPLPDYFILCFMTSLISCCKSSLQFDSPYSFPPNVELVAKSYWSSPSNFLQLISSFSISVENSLVEAFYYHLAKPLQLSIQLFPHFSCIFLWKISYLVETLDESSKNTILILLLFWLKTIVVCHCPLN